MSIFFIYSLKVTLCLTAFYLVYKLLLSRDTFFAYNRFVLLGLCALSLSLPLAQVSTSNPSPVVAGFAVVETMVVSAEVYEPTSLDFSVTSLCLGVYLLGVLFFLAREIWSLLSLRRLISGGRVVENDGTMKVVVVKDHVSPFSWMGNVVMSEKDYADSPEYIIRHERAHVVARHSWDILACDLLIVFQWYNPAAWLLKSELQTVHEYEADRSVLDSGINATDYQMFLIRKTAGEKLFSAANNLNQYSLKNRITMMKKSKSNKWNHCKVLAVLPVAATAVIAFASPKAESLTNEIMRESDALVSAVRQVAATDSLKGKNVGMLVIQGDEREPLVAVEHAPKDGGTEFPKSQSPDDLVYDVVEEMPEFPGGIPALLTFMKENIKYPAEAQKKGVQGRVIVKFVVDKQGQVTNAKVERPVDPALDAEALRVVNSIPRWTPGKQGGKLVNVGYVLPVHFGLNADTQKKKQDGGLTIVTADDKKVLPYILVDGKHVTDISHIKPDDIESINVYKGKSATDKYGENGKNGVIEITMKKK